MPVIGSVTTFWFNASFFEEMLGHVHILGAWHVANVHTGFTNIVSSVQQDSVEDVALGNIWT